MSRPFLVPIMAPLAAILAVLIAGSAAAKLPPLSEQQKQDIAQKAAKTAYNDKIDAYKLCQAQDRVAVAWRNSPAAAAKPAPIATMTAAVAIAPCAEPAPFEATIAQKPLEAAGAHSPPETAKSPPSTSTPSGDPSQAPKR